MTCETHKDNKKEKKTSKKKLVVVESAIHLACCLVSLKVIRLTHFTLLTKKVLDFITKPLICSLAFVSCEITLKNQKKSFAY